MHTNIHNHYRYTIELHEKKLKKINFYHKKNYLLIWNFLNARIKLHMLNLEYSGINTRMKLHRLNLEYLGMSVLSNFNICFLHLF